MTLENETETVNAVVWPNVLEHYRRAVLVGPLAMVRGRVQRAGEIVHSVAASLEELIHWLDPLTSGGGKVRPSTARAGARREQRKDASSARHPRDQRVIPNSRNFR